MTVSCTVFEILSYIPKISTGHLTAITLIWRTVCRPKANTSYRQPVTQPVYKTWSL